MILLFLRFVGLAAAVSISWKVLLLALLPLMIIGTSSPIGRAKALIMFDSGAPRLMAEFFSLAVGMWALARTPLLPEGVGKLAVVGAGLLLLAYIADVFNKGMKRRY